MNIPNKHIQIPAISGTHAASIDVTEPAAAPTYIQHGIISYSIDIAHPLPPMNNPDDKIEHMPNATYILTPMYVATRLHYHRIDDKFRMGYYGYNTI